MLEDIALQNTDTGAYFSLGDMLQLGSMSGARLLAGSTGLTNNVSRTNVVESADLPAWSETGDVLISSGYAFRSNPEILLAQLPELLRSGVCALCLKPVRPGHQLPDSVINLADELGFPLLELPMTAVFANIVQESMEEILAKKVLSFREVQDTTERLLNAMWRTDHPEDALQLVETVLHNPVLIFDSENSLSISTQTREFLDNDLQNELIREMYNHSPKDALTLNSNGRTVTAHFLDIGSNDGIYIVLLEYYAPFRHIDRIILRQIGHSLVLEMKNAMVAQKIRQKYKRQFVEDLLSGRLDGDAVNICVTARTDGYNLNLDSLYRVVVMNLHLANPNVAFTEQDVSIIRHIIRNLDSDILFNVQQSKLILVLEDDRNWSTMLNNLSHLSEKLNYIMDKGKMTFCISDPCPLDEISSGYQQALKISDISQHCGIREQVVTCDKLGVLYLLSMLPQSDAVTRYKAQFLSPLKKYDDKHGSNLTETLRVYLDLNCNKRFTAEQLHTHYNTVVYRIARAEELLNLSLNDTETQFQLRIAFKLDLLS
jgi:PucR family transcriptional regulator, purine catabolism regulatory protein